MRSLVINHLERTTFCWLPPGQLGHRLLLDLAEDDTQPFNVVLRRRPLASRSSTELGQLRQQRQSHVLGDAHRHQQALVLAVFRYVGVHAVTGAGYGTSACRRSGQRRFPLGRCAGA